MPVASRQKRRKKLAAGAAVALGAALSPEAIGAVITVNSTADTVAADAQCTLREALTNANDDAATVPECTAGSGADTINFSGLTFPATITLGGTFLPITDAVTIDGPGATDLTIDGNDASRIFTIDDDDPSFAMAVSIDGLLLTNGNAMPESIPTGGAILNAEDLTLTEVAFTDNTSFGGGAILHESGQVVSTLTIGSSSFTGNSASYGGAILSSFGNVEITGSTFNLNSVDCCGGAINQSSGNFSITGSSVTGNTAFVAGGIALYYVTNITVSDTTISGNEALDVAGGLYIYAPQGVVLIEDSIISGNEAGTFGGGLHMSHSGESQVTIVDTEISGNIAGDSSGGLYLYDMDNVEIERLRLTDNVATNFQGGAALFDVQATIIESQITGNQAASAGGLYAGYGTYLYLINTTIANNTATTGSVGGLGVNTSFAAVDVSTISGNSAPAGAAGNVFTYGAGLYVENSIIANGTAVAGPDMVNVDSSVTLDYSLLENTAGAVFTGANNLTGVDPQLGPLADNGGPTETMKPATGSPVIDAGDPLYTTPPNDQRGFVRPVNVVDMGAVEVNPGVVTLSSDSYSVNEADGFVTITVNRTGGSDGAVAVNYTTGDGSAVTVLDYTTTSGTLNWADGDTDPKTFNIPITNDVVFEGTETFTVSLNTPVGASLGTSSANVAILDNESAPTITINNTGAVEGHVGNTPASFTVELSHPTTQTVTVNYATASGTATSGTDFVDTNGTLQFDPMVTELILQVPVIGDTIDEADETFTLTLSTPENATILDGTGVATITDDDLGPTLAIGNVTQDEGTGANSTFTFNVTLTGTTEQTVTVNYSTAGVTATTGTDFTATSGTLTFEPGVTSLPVNVTVVADAIDEINETFNVTLDTPANATITDDTGLGTITDDDAAPTLAISDVTQAEGTGANPTFAFNVSLTGATEQTVTVNYGMAGVTATNGTDFTVTSGTLTFNPGTTSLPVNVTVIADAIDEPDETFNVTLNTPGNATITDDTALGTITDDDPTPTISIGNVTQAEGTGANSTFTFNVTLSGPSQSTVTVNYDTAGVTATTGDDFTATSGTLTFNPGVTSLPVNVTVIADSVDEPDETFNVNLNTPNAAATILDGSGLGTITDDDAPPTLSIGNVTQAEGTGANSTFTFNVTLSGPSQNTVTVDYDTTGITATTGTDFTDTSGTLTFNPGVTSLPVNVTVIADAMDEPDETFTVDLDTPNAAATILDGSGLGTITDDDPTPTISIGDVTQLEGTGLDQVFAFNVTLSNPSQSTVTVNYSMAGVSATEGVDFVPTSGTLTFNPGVTSLPVNVQVIADALDEPSETFNVTLDTPNAAATILDGTALGTITDDDGAPALTIDNVTLGEGDAGTTNFVFTVTLAPGSGQTVTVDYETQAVSATAGVDYTTTSGTLTFVPGDTTETITVPVTGEMLVEPDEVFNVVLGNAPLATISDDTGVGTITNDDSLPILNIDDVSLAEGNAGTTNFVFTVSLSAPGALPVTVNYTTADGTATTAGGDYALTAGSLTFIPGDTTETITVPVTGDTAGEPAETFTVVLSGETQAAMGDGTGTGTILNDDTDADLSVTKAIVGSGPFTVGDNAIFTITVTNAGPATATNVVVSDTLPDGTSFVSATPTAGTCTGTVTVQCNVGTLANGGSATITLTVRLDTAGDKTNTATAASDLVDANGAAGSAPFAVAGPAGLPGQAIPTLSEWMLIALASALAAAAALKLKPQ